MSTDVYVLSPDDPYQMEIFQRFAPEDANIIWVDNRQSLEEQAAQLREARAIVIAPSEFSIDLALKCPNLKLLQTVSAGTNMLDIKALEELGIQVANNGGGNAVAVARTHHYVDGQRLSQARLANQGRQGPAVGRGLTQDVV